MPDATTNVRHLSKVKRAERSRIASRRQRNQQFPGNKIGFFKFTAVYWAP
jgi:hypothetical protein